MVHMLARIPRKTFDEARFLPVFRTIGGMTRPLAAWLRRIVYGVDFKDSMRSES